MSDNGNFTFQTHPNRQPKVNPFQGKKGETSDPSVLNSGQGANVNARPPTLPNNHHQGSQQSHYQNHRPYPQRGRGGHYGSQNTFGSHSTNRRYSPASHIPNAEDIVNYMDSLWQDFKKEFKESTGVDLQEEVPVQQSSVLQPPMSPRVSGHVNSPHRGQPQQHRYSHQNSTGFGWSVNSGSGNGGRRFSENGEHSSTSSLRRHHNNNNRGGGNYNAPLNNQSWQRGGNFNNRQNSPNSTLNRQGSRPTPRPIVIATPPPAVSNVAVPPSPSQQQESAVTDMMESLSLKQQPPIESAAVRPQKSSAPAAPSNGNGGRKNVVDVMSTADQYFTPEPPSSPSSVSASVKATGSPTPTND
ncbi:unnamed protein product [Hymenolepis diminuta]|uniref:Uncharacterized protein n=1 Tax=Hymenolepis diminuta TaxID=6216 RepID=A0A564Y2W6_HYMDI|nr:unnamed protein product [Hymenolepis diminuta]